MNIVHRPITLRLYQPPSRPPRPRRRVGPIALPPVTARGLTREQAARLVRSCRRVYVSADIGLVTVTKRAALEALRGASGPLTVCRVLDSAYVYATEGGVA